MRYFTTSGNAPDRGTIFWKDVDEGWIRYDQCSGHTHLLTPLARFIVDSIDTSSTPLSAFDIAEKVLNEEPDADSGQCIVEVEAALSILSEAQLIQVLEP